ncbi:MAG: DsrE family protein [Acidiferrobacter sp.]
MRKVLYFIAIFMTGSLCIQSASAMVLNDAHALRGLHTAKAVFLVDINNPQVLTNVLGVASLAYTSMARQGVKPHFVVVIIGPDVAFLTKKLVGISYMKREAASHLQAEIKKMNHMGIRFEACGFSLTSEVDINPHDVIREVHPVGNGFISAIGYQAQGYELVPVY